MRPGPDFNPQSGPGGGVEDIVPHIDIPMTRGSAYPRSPASDETLNAIRPASVVGRHVLDGVVSPYDGPGDSPPVLRASANQSPAGNEGAHGDAPDGAQPPTDTPNDTPPFVGGGPGPMDSELPHTPYESNSGSPPISSEANANDPNDFTSIDVWYDDEPLPVTPEERAVLAASAAEFGPFSSEVYRLSDVNARYRAEDEFGAVSSDAHESPDVNARYRVDDEPRPDDELPLGDDMGLDAIAYPAEIDGKRYVVRFAKGPDSDENTEMTKLRLLTLARTELHEAPHLERLVTYDLPENAVVTKWAEGTPANELSPDDIADIPGEVLVSLQETATKMEEAKVALDIKWGAEGEVSEDALDAVVAHYDTQAGPTYFDLTNAEAYQGRPNEAGRHYAELVTTMVATGYSLDATAGHSYQPLTLQGVVARVELFDKAYRRVQATWPDSSGAGWLARTAGRMIQTLPAHEQDLVMADADRVVIPLDYRDEY